MARPQWLWGAHAQPKVAVVATHRRPPHIMIEAVLREPC